MNKLAIGAAVALLLALLALPGLVGSVTEARVRERVAAIDASETSAAQLTAFERGWFRSMARIDLGLAEAAMAQLGGGDTFLLGTGSLPIVVQFAHGPVAVLDGVHFGWSKIVARVDAQAPGITELEQTLGVPYLFEFRGRTNYRGTLSFDADAPQFELPVDEALFTFSGAMLEGTFAGRHLVADALIGALEFSSPTGTFAVRNIRATMDNELRSQYVMPGQAALSVEQIAITDSMRSATPMFEAANVTMSSDVALHDAGALLEMQMSYGLGSVRIEDSELTDGAVTLTAHNLDVAAIEAYTAAARDAAAAGDPGAALAAIGPHLERALKVGPSLTVDPIRFRLDDEPFEGRIVLTTNTPRLPPAGTLRLDSPLLLLGLFNTEAEVRLSKPLALTLATLAARLQFAGDDSVPPDQLDYMAEAQSGLMLTLLVGQGVLIEEGDGYRSSLELRDGALALNGNPLPFGLP